MWFRWICISAMVTGLIVPAALANCGNCGGDKDAKAEKQGSGCDKGKKCCGKDGSCCKDKKSACHKDKSGCSKSARTVADKGDCSTECLDKAFSSFDANSDGKIDRAEFKSGMPKMMKVWSEKRSGHSHEAMTVLTSAKGEKSGKAGCEKSCAKTGSEKSSAKSASLVKAPNQCSKNTATVVLAAFDLDQNGNLSAAEIERANSVLLAVVDVAKSEHKRLSSDSCCPKTKATGTSIEKMASRSQDSLNGNEAKKSAAPPIGASSDASSPRGG